MAETYLRMKGVRARYGCSHMWVERRLRDGSGFPQPIQLGSPLRCWRVSDLDAWDKLQAEKSAKEEN